MLELNAPTDKHSQSRLSCQLSYGGDSLNTSVYLARLGSQVSYFTAVGDDELSQWMISQWRDENVNCDYVCSLDNSVAGMYLIELDQQGERSFKYWRKNSPASQWLNDSAKREEVFTQILEFDYFYLSGISIAILPHEVKQALLDFIDRFRAKGGKFVFDGNYRPNLWSSREVAAEMYGRLYSRCDVALPTFEDEQAIFLDQDKDVTIDRLSAYGIACIALKLGEKGCALKHQDGVAEIAPNVVEVVDTTSAGDAFNAGFIHKLVLGERPEGACGSGQKLASTVIQHRGAIIPQSAMPTEI